MRLGEYLRCDKGHINALTFAIDVPGTKTPDSRARIYVDPEFWPWIEAGIPAPLSERWIRHHWKVAARECGAGELRLHDLRHAFAIFASDAGVPTAQIQAALRHAGPEMTRRYEMQRARRGAAETVGRVLMGALEPKERPKLLPDVNRLDPVRPHVRQGERRRRTESST